MLVVGLSFSGACYLVWDLLTGLVLLLGVGLACLLDLLMLDLRLVALDLALVVLWNLLALYLIRLWYFMVVLYVDLALLLLVCLVAGLLVVECARAGAFIVYWRCF